MRPVLAFDMNGTLLDPSALDPFFTRHLQHAHIRHEWFAELIGLANLATITGYFEPLSSLANTALEIVGHRYGVLFVKSHFDELKQLMTTLPAFPDVVPALEKLHNAKFRMAILTNSPHASAKTVAEANDLNPYLERIISVESYQRYKPDAMVYHKAAQDMGCTPSELMLIAAHSWDTTGALRAGCQAAFVQRPGETLPAGAPHPAIVAKDMNALAEKLCAEHK